MIDTTRLGNTPDPVVSVDVSAGDAVTRDVRHDVVHAASTAQLLVTALRSVQADAERERLLDGVARCVRDITAMMIDTPDEARSEVIDIAPLAVRAGQNTEMVVRGMVEIDAERSLVRASAADVIRLLNNVLENAVRAAMPDGTIQLSVVNEETRSVIRVGDSGPGFVERTSLDGVGIAVVAAIAVRLGGELILGRSALGGALVTVSLPRALSDDSPTRAGSEYPA